MILTTIYLALIIAAVILHVKKRKNEPMYSVHFIKGLLFGFATGSEDDEDAIGGKVEHHFQLGFGFLVFTMTWLENVED
jgi:hypothetical protein